MDGVASIACGENHTLVLTTDFQLFSCGSNDKFQLGLQGRSKEYNALNFELIESLSSVPIQKIKCWNFSAAIDQNNSLYVWGSL
jgi:alpha-tubulin suppressor-like RCC1 family protein